MCGSNSTYIRLTFNNNLNSAHRTAQHQNHVYLLANKAIEFVFVVITVLTEEFSQSNSIGNAQIEMWNSFLQNRFKFDPVLFLDILIRLTPLKVTLEFQTVNNCLDVIPCDTEKLQ